MCQFLSGVLTNDDKLYFGRLDFHAGIAEGWGLKPGSYREFEWTEDDNGESLMVRIEPDDEHNENWYRAVILAQYAT